MAFAQPLGLSEPDTAPSGEAVGRVTPMMEQYSRSRPPIRTACCSTGWAISTNCSSTTPRSPRARGIVLTKRGKHLGRDIPMCGVPIERADEYLHRLIALGHRVAVCEQLEDPARRASAAEIGGAARRRAPGHARHAHRRHAARRQAQQLSAGAGAGAHILRRRTKPLRARLDRYLDRGIPHRRMRGNRPRRRGGARRAERSHCLRRALFRPGACALLARLAACGAAHARRVRRRNRRAPPRRLFRHCDDGSVRRAVAARADGGGGLRDLCRAHADRQAPAAVAAGARSRRRDARHRFGLARQP